MTSERRGGAGDGRRARRRRAACACSTLGSFVLALLLAGGAVFTAPSRRDGILRVGSAVAGVAGVTALLATFAPVLLFENAGARGVLATWLDPLAVWCWALFGAGLVVASAAASILRPVLLVPLLRRAGDARPAPAGPAVAACRPRGRGDRDRRAGDRGPADRARGPGRLRGTAAGRGRDERAAAAGERADRAARPRAPRPACDAGHRAGRGADRRPGGDRVRRRGRPRAGAARALQRAGRAVRPHARRGRVRRHPQLDGGRRRARAGCSPPRTPASTRSCATACARC